MDRAERFWSYVNKTEDCWLWTGAKSDGYGVFRWPGRSTKAYRISYEECVGPIPEGEHIDHVCHDPKVCPGGKTCPHRACVNPSHLKPGPQSANLANDRHPGNGNGLKTHCPKGHEYTEKNTRLYRGRRHCRECALIREVERKRKSRACPICGKFYNCKWLSRHVKGQHPEA